jgi:hypothetical protein
MTLSIRQRLAIGTLLALVMVATRVNHFAPIPDASWAVFLAAGFYLRGNGRIVFPLLMALAVAVDAYVINAAGLSFWNHYCVSVAYWFLVPAHLAMWFGGSLLAKAYDGLTARTLGLLAASFLVATSACFLVSNGSFYWLSDTVTNATFPGWIKNFSDWYLPYLRTTGIYVAIFAFVHVVGVLVARELSPAKRALAR